MFEKLYELDNVHIYIEFGDITSKPRVTPANVVSKIGKIINEYCNKTPGIKKDDFKEIIHIVDTDGVFIKNEKVVYGEVDKVNYSTGNIVTFDPIQIQKRNSVKSKCLKKLYSTKEINKIPYRVYYMSSNLDHVLFNKQNSTTEDKRRDSHCFSKKYKDDLQGFKNFISYSSFSVNKDYLESWDFIQEGENSLNRYTNLGICILKL